MEQKGTTSSETWTLMTVKTNAIRAKLLLSSEAPTTMVLAMGKPRKRHPVMCRTLEMVK